MPCVYCDFKTPLQHVSTHINIRHAHCRFACFYCLYRAVKKEYVLIHQDMHHPDEDYSVVQVAQMKQVRKYFFPKSLPTVQKKCPAYICGGKYLYNCSKGQQITVFLFIRV